MQDSIKQQNTFTTIAAVNVEVIASQLLMGVMNGYSIQTKVNRGVDLGIDKPIASTYSYTELLQNLR